MDAKDIICIKGLKIAATIGVWEWEQRIKQNLILDIEFAKDIRQASATDKIQHAVSYKDVSDSIFRFVSAGEFKLIETVAENVADLILSQFPIHWCKVTVSKPRAVENSLSVGVIIERSRAKAS